MTSYRFVNLGREVEEPCRRGSWTWTIAAVTAVLGFALGVWIPSPPPPAKVSPPPPCSVGQPVVWTGAYWTCSWSRSSGQNNWTTLSGSTAIGDSTSDTYTINGGVTVRGDLRVVDPTTGVLLFVVDGSAP